MLLCLSIEAHEMAVFSVLPLVMGYLILMDKQFPLTRWAKIFLPAMVAFSVISLLGHTVQVSNLVSYFDKAQACNYPIMRKDYFDLFDSGLVGNNVKRYGYSMQQFLWAVVPVSVFAAAMLYSLKRVLALSSLRTCCLFVCSIAPLLLGFAGSDTERWIFVTFVQTLVIWFFASLVKPDMKSATLARMREKIAFLVMLCVVVLLLRLQYFYGAPRNLTMTNISTFASYVLGQLMMIPQA